MNLSKTKNAKEITLKPKKDTNPLQKNKPRTITIEKERLYDENLEIKQQNNYYKQEILKFKAKIQQLSKELFKKDENTTKNSNSLALASQKPNIKSKIKDLNSKLHEKSEQIEKLEKTIESSKFLELEKEVLVYSEECVRLKKIIESLLGPGEQLQQLLIDKYSDLNSIIEDLKRQNKDLKKSLSFHKEELQKAKYKIIEYEEKLKKIRLNKTDLNSTKNELNKIKEINESLSKSLIESSGKEKNLKSEISNLRKTLKNSRPASFLETGFKEEDFKSNPVPEAIKEPLMVKTLKSALSLSGQSLETFLEGLDKPKTGTVSFDTFSRSLQKLGVFLTNSHFNSVPSACSKKNRTIDLKVLFDLAKDSCVSLPFKTAEFQIFNKQTMDQGPFPPVHPRPKIRSLKPASFPQSKNSKSEKKPSNLNSSQKIDQLLNESKGESNRNSVYSFIEDEKLLNSLSHIKYKMQQNRLDKSKLSLTLFKSFNKDQKITKAEFFDSLKNFPFCFKDPAITDPLLSLITADSTVKQLLSRVLSCLPDWEIFSSSDEEIFDYQLGQIFSKYKEDLKTECKALDPLKSGTISLNSFEDILKSHLISIPDSLWNYMKLLFYSNESKLDSVPYRYFIKAYGNPIESHHSRSIVTEGPESDIVNFYLSYINTFMKTNNLALTEIFESDDDGLINTQQFISGLNTIGFDNIDHEQISIVMEALRFQGSIDLCLSIEEINEILNKWIDEQTSISSIKETQTNPEEKNQRAILNAQNSIHLSF